MENKAVSEIVKAEVNKVLEHLESEYKIILSEVSYLPYGVKYEVKSKKLDRSIGILIIYYGKRGFKLTREKFIYEEEFYQIEEVFNNRDNLNETIIEKSKLDKLYEILKPYSNEKFDFSDFANELLKNCDDNEEKKFIEENIYNFKNLEKFYINIKEEK